ncbi:hypothetical protein HJG60_012179 [Phyllostomus discolor]|uniref:Uncharacterized protein n=1 Tax=Phyllostomus discolor TaxID=89673 RepID=A0A834DP57_9CHIR|nr:hypothetical protein HJG60_012179 [Phyllostomus discolor]
MWTSWIKWEEGRSNFGALCNRQAWGARRTEEAAYGPCLGPQMGRKIGGDGRLSEPVIEEEEGFPPRARLPPSDHIESSMESGKWAENTAMGCSTTGMAIFGLLTSTWWPDLDSRVS